MELVVDANVLLASLLKNAVTRGLLLDSRLILIAPEHLLSETSRHLGKSSALRKRIGLPHDELKSLFDVLTEGIQTKPYESYKPRMKEALAIAPHEEDAPYLAVALAFNMPVWSNDIGMRNQSKIRVYATHEILNERHRIP